MLTPRIKVKADQFGVIVRARTLPRVGLDEYQKAARFLADAWRCTRVSVLPDGPGRVVIRGVRSDPLTTPTEHRPTGRPPEDVARWELGVDEYAAPVCVSLANVPGVTVGGTPGAGKTSAVNKFVCDLAPSAAVQIVGFDGKVSRASEGDYADLMAVIAVLAFVFSFGNVWALALRLSVPRPITPLIAPMVDLSVVGLLIALRYLTLRGVTKAELKAGTSLLHLCGLLTLALKTAEPLLTGRYGRACLDTVAPLLLLGWGHVGPAFLAHFHTAAHLEDATPATTPIPEPVPTTAPAPETGAPVPAAPPAPPPAEVPTVIEVPGSAPAPTVAKARATGSRPALPAALLNAARRIADAHHAEHGAPVTAAQLATRMGVALPVATAALAQL